MTYSEFELTRLDPNTFEHLVNSLALHVLGAGHTGFGPGPDGGRDGFFEGASNYPSEKDAWSGIWYIQSKFHAPNLSKDHGKWLLAQLEEELKAFAAQNTKRKWPDIYILATNFDPSGVPETGVYDQAKALVKKYRPQLVKRFHIWGGAKILSLLSTYEAVAAQYGEFVTAGHVIRNIYKTLNDASADGDDILRHFLVTDFQGQLYSKLEQAGSDEEDKPPLQDIFTDLPFITPAKNQLAAKALAKSLAYPQALPDDVADIDLWERWQRDPERARIWFIKGGPGQGKSTITQFIAQVQRASLILTADGPSVTPKQKKLARNIKQVGIDLELWPIAPRIPVTVELKSYAQWFGEQPDKATRLLAYLEYLLTRELAQGVLPGTLKRLFSSGRWLFIFDGLDEVPGDIKDKVAHEVVHFVDNLLVGLKCDASIVCTSRPQGYSGQFDVFQSANLTLAKLSREKALACAKPLLRHKMSEKDSSVKIGILEQALSSPSVASLMTTPLQSHIMAIIVRIGGRPPERKWKLFDRFYEVIKKREADKDFPDARLNKLLSSENKLIRALHNRLGFELHSRAETKSGATTALTRSDFEVVVTEVVSSLQDIDIDETVSTLMEAATERLVLVNTPENGETVRFDVRQLQEFFAAEEIAAAAPDIVAQRFQTIAGDSHWAEVVHFLLSGFVENERRLEISSAISSLLELDEGQSDTRDLNRRLAHGGLIVRRILVEGVLEHDRRVRNQFANCLSALLTTPEAPSYLAATPGDHSRSWLIDLLLRSLREKSEEEVLGAAATLIAMIDDGHPSSNEAFELISTKSTSFRSALFRESQFPEDERGTANWVGRIAFDVLKADNWYLDSEDVISSLTAVILEAHRSGQFLHEFFSRDTAATFSRFIDYRHLGNTNSLSKEMLCKEKIEIHYIPNDGPRDWNTWSSEILAELTAAGGYFKAIAAVCKYLKSPTHATYEALFDISPNLEWLRKLPGHLGLAFNRKALVTASPFSDCGHIVDNSPYAGKLRAIYHHGPREFTEEDWIEILHKIPEHFCHLLTFGERHLPAAIWSSPKFIDAICDFDPDQLASIISHLPNSVPEDLRSAVIAKVVEFGDGNLGNPAYVRKVLPFELRLPEEACLLPWIVNMLTERASMELVLNGEASPDEGISHIVKGYICDPNKLADLISDQSVSIAIKAAAAIMLSLHFASGELLSKYDWNQWYSPAEAPWLIPALCHANTPNVRVRDESSMRKLASVLSLARKDYPSKFASSAVILSWRELAYQPLAGSPADLWQVIKD
ncbi:hypothetical protein NMA58_00880 [Rhizobium sp. YTUHZ045]|uniref:NACHT domain-containing protein n=1 Tax=Rhizobium sp. YTUHZ045 TaxID=2962888 RepID=UPI003DA8BA63